MKKKKIKRISILLFLLSSLATFLYLTETNTLKKDKVQKKEIKHEIKTINIEKIKNSFNETVLLKNNSHIYQKIDNNYQEIATNYKEKELTLDITQEIKDEYFKIANTDYYIYYKDITKIDSLSPLKNEYKTYKNYIPYQEKIITKDKVKLYQEEDNYYEVSKNEYQIIIKEEDRYGIEFLNQLYYINKSDIEKTEETEKEPISIANKVSALNYHYVVSAENENNELNECNQEICITDTMFEKHISYLKENNYYAATIRDLELFIDGKIQLPEHTVLITIDDGWYVARSITILEKYQILGTLFLIGSLASPESYQSEYLEIHSHTWDMHTIGQCPSNIGRGGILCLEKETVLNDLKKSRESLDNTTYFCYPFYDYNTRAISLLKEAGFTMAFAGEKRNSDIYVGQDKFTIPRYVIVNYTTMNEFINYVD